MNKKWIKIIDFFNMIHNGEKPPEKIMISGHRYKYNEKTKDYDSDMGFDNKDLFLHIGILKELDTEMAILEDNIEEIQVSKEGIIIAENAKWKGRKLDIELVNKINELVRAVNKLRKEKG